MFAFHVQEYLRKLFFLLQHYYHQSLTHWQLVAFLLRRVVCGFDFKDLRATSSDNQLHFRCLLISFIISNFVYEDFNALLDSTAEICEEFQIMFSIPYACRSF